MFLVLLKNSHWVGFNEGNLEIFRFKNMGDIKFWVVFVIENSIELQNMGFGMKRQLGNEFTLDFPLALYFLSP
jgi:hypothetical protein